MDPLEPDRAPSAGEPNEEEPGVLDALARFLLAFDLPVEEGLPPGAEPVLPDALLARLGRALEALRRDERASENESVRHGRLRLTLARHLIGEETYVFAGVTRAESSRAPAGMKEPGGGLSWPGGETPAYPPLRSTSPAAGNGFDQHFRGLRGEFHSMRPRDLIQFFCSCATTVEVRFTTNLAQRGEVLIDQGRVIHCASGDLEGDEAALAMMNWESGNFLTRPLRENAPETVTLPWMTLMLEHARELDESGEFLTIDTEVQQETLEALPDWMDAEIG